MNYRAITILLLFGVFFFSGCQRKIQRPVTQSHGNYQTDTPRLAADSVRQSNVPKRVQPNKPVVVYDSSQETQKKEGENLVSIYFVEERLQAYQRKLEKWKEYDNQSSVLNLDREATEQMIGCFRDLQKMINGYGKLRNMLVGSEQASLFRDMSPVEIQALQESDVRLLESPCGRLLEGDQGMDAFLKPGVDEDPAKLESLIKQSFRNKEYEQVVQLWLEISEEKMSQITVQTKLVYGKSLMFLHQEQKAALVYEQAIRDIRQNDMPDILGLHKALANIYMASGNYPAAAGQYRKILENYNEVLQSREWAEQQQAILKNPELGDRALKEYSAILRNYLGYIPSQDGYKPVWQAEQFLKKYPESPVMTNVDQIKSKLHLKAEMWFKKLIADIEALQLQENYRDGLVLLETIPRDIIGPDQIQLIEKKNMELTSAEEAVRESLMVEKMQALKDRWEQILSLVDNDEYDEAIVQLHSLEHTEYAEKVAAKLSEVSLLAAKKNRQEAARLFIQAAGSADSEEKKKNLLESHQLLMAITLKYPEARIIDKVVDNMRTVEAEIDKLDPTLVEWSRMAVKQEIEMESQQAMAPEEMETDDDEREISPFDVQGADIREKDSNIYQKRMMIP